MKGGKQYDLEVTYPENNQELNVKKEGKMREEIDKKVLSECSCNYIIDGDNKVKTIKVVRLDFDKCYELMHDDSVPKTNVLRWGSVFKAKTINEISELLGDDLLTPKKKEKLLESIRAANKDKELLAAWEKDKDAWKDKGSLYISIE